MHARGTSTIDKKKLTLTDYAALAEAWVPALVRNVEEAYLSFRDGRLDEEYWLTRAEVLSAVLDSDVGMRVYSEMSDQVVPDFRNAMDAHRASKQ